MAMDHALVRRLRTEVAEQSPASAARTRCSGCADEPGGRAAVRPRRSSPASLDVARPGRDRSRAGRRRPRRRRRSSPPRIHAALYGVGRLQPLLDDPRWRTSTSTAATGSSSATRTAASSMLDPVAETDEELVELVQMLGGLLGAVQPAVRHRQPAARPAAAGRLPALGGHGGHQAARRSRSGAPGCPRSSCPTWSATARIDQGLAAFLRAAVVARKNIMIAGSTNAGKTTLLRALANEIPPHERLITVERALELGLDEFPDLHPNVVAFEERLPNSEGQGRISMAELVRRSLRMNPSRVIVGEVLGDEIVTMLNAMSQGNDGSLSTIHANSSLGGLQPHRDVRAAGGRAPADRGLAHAHRRRDQLRGLRRAAQRLPHRRPAAPVRVQRARGQRRRRPGARPARSGPPGPDGRARPAAPIQASTTWRRPATGRTTTGGGPGDLLRPAARAARRRARRRRRAAAGRAR